jgi:hypothetical protein
MSKQLDKIAKRLRIAGIFVLPGLLVEAFSLIWNHPLAFIAFATIGLALTFMGIAVYLLSLLQYTSAEEQARLAAHKNV